MENRVFKMGNLVMCSPAMFANNAQMVDEDPGLLPQELVYLTHGSAFDIGGIDEIGREGMRKMLGKIADQVTAFALLRYSEQEGCWVRSEFSHFESVVDYLSRVYEHGAAEG